MRESGRCPARQTQRKESSQIPSHLRHTGVRQLGDRLAHHMAVPTAASGKCEKRCSCTRHGVTNQSSSGTSSRPGGTIFMAVQGTFDSFQSCFHIATVTKALSFLKRSLKSGSPRFSKTYARGIPRRIAGRAWHINAPLAGAFDKRRQTLYQAPHNSIISHRDSVSLSDNLESLRVEHDQTKRWFI